MLIAIDKDDNRVHIDDTKSNQQYYCPYCGVPLITKKGNIRQHHFSHSASHSCTDSWERSRSYDMSPWHNEWQNLFPKENQEVKLSLGNITHRADILTGKTVIEFQHSIMSVRAFDDRNSFYFNLGYKVIWLFDLSDLFSSGALTYDESGDDSLIFTWNNPKKAFNSYDVNCGCIDLFFQLSNDYGKEKIIRVRDVSDDGFIRFKSSLLMTKNDFLNYVGLNDGSFAAPDREDLEKSKEYQIFCQKYGISLNKQQERAVQAVEGSNLLLAVPGSGKTTVLITRLGHMVINKKINPERILAITFNKQAAEEMKERFGSVFEKKTADKITFQTINALCYNIYLRYCYKHNRQIKNLIDDGDNINRKKFLSGIIKKYYDEYPTESDILQLNQGIGFVKNMEYDRKDVAEIDENFPYFSNMIDDYEKALSKNNRMDYDDQMRFAKWILLNDKTVLDSLRAKYKYICVDEAQDTSKIQHAIIKLISEGNNLFMVGDEDQSIYGFRGAYPKALLNFKYDYKNPYIMRMEKNYRSTTQIVEKAQKFISKNKGRYEKNMTAERGSGDEVELISVANREAQYNYILNVAKTLKTETAVLYRDNDSSVVLVDLLMRNRIPFVLKKPEMNYFNSKVVLDIKAYLKLTIDQYDYESLEAICNKGILYLKKQQLDFAIKECKYHHANVFDALQNQMPYLKSDYRDRAIIFKLFITGLAAKTPYDAITSILRNGYEDYMVDKHLDFGKIELLKMLAKKETTISSFLRRLAFLESQIKNGFTKQNEESIILSTIHSSKGLEYDTVYLIDVYDGRFPSSIPNLFSRSKDNADGEQEERRLFYVGLTRAKNKLYLFDIEEEDSSFIDELFEDDKP